MIVANCELAWKSAKGNLHMKTVVSVLLGAVVLFGAATLGVQSASASPNNHHHHKHHHKHHRHSHGHKRVNKLSY